ncbi:MAG: glycosyltransferase family 9 protein [Puniceicoccales bacterium]|nr:glycosyltransferase family 9 protein [Puniceicoccales bacterium]
MVKPSSLGDIVHALQVVAALKRSRPEISVSWVVRDSFAPLVRASGLVDALIKYRRGGFCPLLGLLQCCRRIVASGSYGVVWDMQGLLRSALMGRWARSKRLIGRRDGREFSRLFYGEVVSEAKSPHAVDILSQFLPTLSVEAVAMRPIGFASEQLPPCGLFAGERTIVISPESRGSAKEWKHYGLLTENLCRRFPNYMFAWVGLGVGGHIAPEGFENFFDLRGKTSIGQLTGLIGRCDGVIANDSACMHLAAAMAKPVLGIFLCTDPRRCGPYPLDADGHFVAMAPSSIQFRQLEAFLLHVHGTPTKSCGI